MSNRILNIDNLQCTAKTIWGSKVLLDISHLDMCKGEILGLIGESGAGKSLLAQSILKILPRNVKKTKGSISFDGVDIDSITDRIMSKEYRGQKMSMIFQDPMASLNPVFTVYEQIYAVIKQHNHHLTSVEINSRAIEILKLVRLSDPEITMTKYPHELSGGMRQRVLIALALCSGSKFLISDEATRALDVTIQAGILELLKHLREELGLSILFISSNVPLAVSISDRVGILYEGQIVEVGCCNDILTSSKHIYTQQFLASLTTPDMKGKKINVALTEKSSVISHGCRFANKCHHATNQCLAIAPFLKEVGIGHYVACHLYN